MKKIIFSLYRDDLEDHTSVGPEKREAFAKYADQLNEVKSTYANHVGAEYKLFRPESTEYDEVQFQKLTMFEELAKDYDEILYLDYDVIPFRNDSFFDKHDLNTICAFNVRCKLDRQTIAWRNYDRNWHGMDMYSKAQNKRAMLLLHDISGKNMCLNTGVVGMNKKMVKKLDLTNRLIEAKETFDECLTDNLYPPMMSANWKFNNEVALSYMIDRFELPFTNIGQQWNFIVDNNIPTVSDACYFLHFVHKRFEMYFSPPQA